jgi:hypothetical protein
LQNGKTRKRRGQLEKAAKQSKAGIGTFILRQGALAPVMVTKRDPKAVMPEGNRRE